MAVSTSLKVTSSGYVNRSVCQPLVDLFPKRYKYLLGYVKPLAERTGQRIVAPLLSCKQLIYVAYPPSVVRHTRRHCLPEMLPTAMQQLQQLQQLPQQSLRNCQHSNTLVGLLLTTLLVARAVSFDKAGGKKTIAKRLS